MAPNGALEASAMLDLVPKKLLIGGEWRAAASGKTFEVLDPATGRAICDVANAAEADASDALDAAASAQESWAATSPAERSEILLRAFERMTERGEGLALLMTLEMGKTLPESRAEVAYAAEFFRWFSGEALRIDGNFKVSASGQSRVIVMRQPVGPCYFITPWNFPAAMGTRKIGPAVAAGCTMVVKPAQQTPLTMLALGAILQECGLPSGVLNILTGTSARSLTTPILEDPRLRKISFTGSTEVGRLLLEQAAKGVINTSMELGGNAPFLVFGDADLDAAVAGAVVAKMRNMGEACVAANRFHAAAPVANEFASRLAAALSDLKLGPGTDADAQVGPLIDGVQRDRVHGLVVDAVQHGARCLTGGRPVDGPGYFYEPTVLADVPREARILREEVFGPVAPVTRFNTEEEAVALANDTEYGLVAYVYTRDIGRAMRVCERLETGMIGLNQGMVSNAGAPFGGVKQSGIGREGGNEGIDEYLETKYIALNME